MGSWAIPNTDELARRVEKAMSGPLTASQVRHDLHHAIGDDTLWDMIDEASEIDSSADVRPLIAEHLEMLTRWLPESSFIHPWEPSARIRMGFLAEGYEDAAAPRLRDGVLHDDASEAALQVVEALDLIGMADMSFQSKRVAPGVYALLDTGTDRLFRVQCRYGLVIEAPSEIRDDLKETLFPSNALRMH